LRRSPAISLIGLFSSFLPGLAEASSMNSQTPCKSAEGVQGISEIRVWMTLREASFTMKKAMSAIDEDVRAGRMESRLSETGAIEVLASMPLIEAEVKPLVAQASQQSAVDALAASLMAMSPNKPSNTEVLMERAAPMFKSARRGAASTFWLTLRSMGMGLDFTRRSTLSAVKLIGRFILAVFKLGATATTSLLAGAGRLIPSLGQLWRPSLTPWAAVAVILLLLGSMAAGIGFGPRKAPPDLTDKLQAATASAEAMVAERDQLKAQLAEANEALAKAQNDLTVERNIEDTLFKAIQSAKATQAANNAAFADSTR
jgi:hypothetical protein